ncbi:hypothetical protein CERZMDRAFT_108039 [Cercospora zeae-maydis SCOH1-5]|uniref:Uncharacterized protein n=1 Tax=Cercospora zeae-maydis SCOH1-5 TaxID=717836 RepID=A0A6A6EZQ6_9PEZI|nr:hypothetical protein CERZMDRAFT_108039 [Cercospora zeae-maydis SCOH1-5]
MAATLFSSTIVTGGRTAFRAFSTTSSSRASILFQLGALSNSRETQHFNKMSKLQRFEHSPHLKLIKTSEIDPYPVPIERLLQNAPATRAEPQPAATANTVFKRIHTGPAWDARALAVGRALLADTRRQRTRMMRLVERARKREARTSRLLAEHRTALAKERQKTKEEMRSAGFLILLSVATATGLAMWTFWPAAERARDSGDVGRRIAEKARASMPFPPITSAREVVAGAGAVPVTATVTGEATVAPATVLKEEISAKPASRWDWRGLFWRQQ